VRAEVISTGLFDHDLHLQSGQGLSFGSIDFRNGDRPVRVEWGDCCDPGSRDVAREMPTPEQASALRQLDARLADPASWLPASAWEDPEITAYVPSGYSVCYWGAQGVGLPRVLALLPPAAEDLLRAQDRTQGEYTNLIGSFVYWCSDLANEEARSLARILDDAGLNGFGDVFGLTYGEVEPGATEVSLEFAPLLPHEATAPGENASSDTGISVTKPGVPEVDYMIDLNTGVMTPVPKAIIRSAGKPGESDLPRYAASPDGSKLTYIGIGDDGNPQIFIAGIDGTGVRQLTHDSKEAMSPAWSPDGTMIAYQGSGGLFVLDVATGESTPIG